MQVQRENIRLRAEETFRLLRWSRSVASVEVVLGPGLASPLEGQGDHWHYHPAVELTLIQRGSGTRLVADDIDLFSDGDLVLIGPNVPHYWQMRGTSAGLAIQWDFPDEHVFWNFPEAPRLRATLERSRRGIHIRGRTCEQVRTLMESLVHQRDLARLGTFLQILGILTEASASELGLLSSQSFSLATNEETQEIIRRAVSYILVHYRDEVHLPDLLKLTGMSRATFARQFLLHAGKPFSVFRNQVRLQAVCHALRETTEPIGRIALDHGFNQLSFFNRLFFREFGINPSEYRKAHHRRVARQPSTD